MKFRAKMMESGCIRKFYNIISAISKISKSCVMRLTTDKMYLIMCEMSSLVGGPTIWGEIEKDNLFNEFCLEGVSEEANEIYLDFSPSKLYKTLNSLKSTNVRGLKMKLTKKNGNPCLTFEVDLPSLADARFCVHDIPVTVVPRRSWKDYEAPVSPVVDVSLCLPDLKNLRRKLERLKSLGQSIIVTGRKEGTLTLKVETDDVSVSSHFQDLRTPVLRDQQAPWTINQDESLESASVRVDIKKFHQFLSGESIITERCIANIVNEELLHMMLITQELVLQFYLVKSNRA